MEFFRREGKLLRATRPLRVLGLPEGGFGGEAMRSYESDEARIDTILWGLRFSK
jgi:hypothetical protein